MSGGRLAHPSHKSPAVRALSFHAAYGCRHRGACCEAGWPIPVEAEQLAALQTAVATGALQPAGDAPPFVTPPDAPTDTPALLAVTGGRCVFRTSEQCAIHERLGHGALPLACRQFPRVSVIDPRGVSITLSHFCPTAYDLLSHASGHVAIVEAPAAFPAGAEYSGLDARDALPPLLRPDLLMDWESWTRWETLAVDLLANDTTSPHEGLARLRIAVEQVRTWTPGGGPLLDAVGAAFAHARQAPGERGPVGLNHAARIAEVMSALAPNTQPPASSGVVTGAAPAARFLAAHAFANWTALLGLGLRTWLRSLETPLALLETGYTISQADLLLRHLADPYALADAWNASETTSQVLFGGL